MQRARNTLIVILVAGLIAGSTIAGSGIAGPGIAEAITATPPAKQSVTLREAAEGKFLIGTAISGMLPQDPLKAGIVVKQFDAITAENDFKPARLEPNPGKFDFLTADKIAAFAAAHQQVLIGHTLCWHQQTPAWMFASADGSPLPRAQGLANLKRHIDGVMTHFRGKVRGWDVVNEALDDGPRYLRDTPARRSIGDDYIVRAFELAHAADPAAELYYNDYNIEQGSKRDKALRLIGELKAAGIHLDAVGIQGHWGLDWPPVNEIEQGLIAIHQAGVAVQITELDIDLLPRKSHSANVTSTTSDASHLTDPAKDNPYINGLPNAIARQQADRYGSLFTMFISHRSFIKRVSFWGFCDADSWLNNFPVKGRTNYPLLLDRNLQPKPAFTAVLNALQ